MASPPPEDLLFAEAAKLIVEHARDYAFLVLDLDGGILTWSGGAEQVLGLSAAEAVGRNYSQIFTRSDLASGEDRQELALAWREGRVEDSRWHVRGDGTRFWANGVTMAVRDPDRPPRLIKILRDETAARLGEEQRVLLLNELNHRINNTLVTVQSLMEQTLRAGQVDLETRENLAARLQALSQAHGALMERNWADADLGDLVKRALAPYGGFEDPRFHVEGPPVRLSPPQSVSFSLVLHELATNAVKHGALSEAGGQVAIDWNQSLDNAGRRRVTFLWTEQGGPKVSPPTRRGFGSRLLARSFPVESGGETEIDFAPEGLRCTIRLMLSDDTEQPILDLVAAARGSDT